MSNEQQLREALEAAQKWIAATPHGDNCFVSDHYEGDPGNRCNCGKDAIEGFLEEATVIPEQSVTVGRVLVGKDELKAALRTLRHCGMDAVAHELDKSTLSQPMPEAAAQGWKLVPVELLRQLKHYTICHLMVYPDCGAPSEEEINAMLSASPAAPEGAKPAAEFQCPPGMALVPIRLTREMEQYLMEDDWDWPELLGVAGTVTEEQLAQAEDAQPPHPQPQAQPTPSAEDIHSCSEFCDRPECVAAREAQAQGEPIFGFAREWDGDDSDLGNWLFTTDREETEDGHEWAAVVLLQSHREALAQHRAALEECVRTMSEANYLKFYTTITHANQVLGKKEGGV